MPTWFASEGVRDFSLHARVSAAGFYRKCGFVEEGRQREHVYSDGAYHDQVVMGILRTEWEASE